MSSFDFLKEGFLRFTKNFKKNEFVDNFSLETPPLDLETFNQVHFNTKFELTKLNSIVLSSVHVRTNILLNSFEVFRDIKPVKIKYVKDELSISKNCDLIKFKLTEISSNPASYCKIMLLPQLNRCNSFLNLKIIDLKEFDIHLSLNISKLNEFKNFVMDSPSVERREFWVDLSPVNLNPIGPKYFKDISYRNKSKSLFLSARKTCESLREVEIGTLKEFTLKQEIQSVSEEHWQKKCIVNADALRNDSLIEALQSNGWQIYERSGIFEGTQMIQVSKNAILLLMRLEHEKKPTAVRKSNNIKIILEIEDAKYND